MRIIIKTIYIYIFSVLVVGSLSAQDVVDTLDTNVLDETSTPIIDYNEVSSSDTIIETTSTPDEEIQEEISEPTNTESIETDSYYETPDTNSTFEESFGDEFDWSFSKSDEAKYLVYKPIIGLGLGVLFFKGDVQSNYSDPTLGTFAQNISVSKNINQMFTFNLNVISGKLTGFEKSLDRNFNFESSMISGGVSIGYNFGHFLEKEGYILELKKQRTIFPFVSIGLETFSFSSKGDLYDANGQMYHYWSDGTVRNIEESAGGESVVLHRDYNYETDLRRLDLDGFGMYSQTGFAIPINIGADVMVHDRVTLRVGTSLHYTLNDLIDNISKDGEGIRKGNNMNDMYIYSYFTFFIDVFSSEKITNVAIAGADYPDMLQIYYADEDGDNILDFDDDCIGTPLGVPVNKHGCPIDCDKDGIPDYLEVEYNTPSDSIVDLEGAMFTDEMMSLLAQDTLIRGVEYKDIFKNYPNMKPQDKVKKFDTFYDDIPILYKHIDLDQDGFISSSELYQEIDKFFDGTSRLHLEQIYEVVEFFFNQEYFDE